ncbi:MAG: hypothetical protein L6V93_00825 [Clostridiales bacterium]|nr:MAG: hypothetical protein L6V93_00825 [Clostridiales bacterium]
MMQIKMQVGNDIYRIKKQEFSNYRGYYADVYCKKENGAVDEIVYIEKNDDTDELCIEADDIVSFDNLCYTYGEKEKIGKNCGQAYFNNKWQASKCIFKRRFLFPITEM